MRYSVVVSPYATPSDPVLFLGDVARHAETVGSLGYDAMELHMRNPAEVDPAEIEEACGRFGLTISAVATGLAKRLDGLCFLDPDSVGREAAVRRVFEFVDFAARLEAGVIIGSMRGILPQHDRARFEGYFRSCMSRISDYAGERGVTVYLEAINRYENNYLNTVGESLEWLDRLGCDSVKLLLDTFHMNIEEADMAGAIADCGAALGYMHFADNTRLAPGSGSIDFRRVSEALRQIEYRGGWSVECLPVPDGRSAAREAIEHLKRIATLPPG